MLHLHLFVFFKALNGLNQVGVLQLIYHDVFSVNKLPLLLISVAFHIQ